MSTTALFAELFVVGTQVSIWIAFVLYYVVGPETLKPYATDLEAWSFLVTAIAFGIVYTVGVVFERVAGVLLPIKGTTVLLKRVRWIARKAEWIRPEIPKLRFHEGTLGTDLEYTLSRIRIVRSALLNLAIIVSVFALLWLFNVISLQRPFWAILLAVVLMSVCSATLVALLISYDAVLRVVSKKTNVQSS